MGKLEGKVAFITGAARGQGRAHAVGLAQEGADIVAVDICAPIATVPYPLASPDDMAETAKLVEDLGRRILPIEADVRDLAAMRAAAQRAKAELARLDIVVANAGILNNIGERADDDQAFYDAVDVMLTGVWHTIRATTPIMIEQGSGGAIVITSSTAGLKGLCLEGGEAGSAGYGAAKHAVVGLMRLYANVLAPHRIRVTTVHPTGVNSPMVANEAFGRFAAEHPELGEYLRNPLPVKLIEPEDVTKAVVWLVSDDARYVTGSGIAVDAGFVNRV